MDNADNAPARLLRAGAEENEVHAESPIRHDCAVPTLVYNRSLGWGDFATLRSK